MRYYLAILLSWLFLLAGRAQSSPLLLQNPEYSGLMNPANTLSLANALLDLRAGIGYRQAKGSWLPQDRRTENRLAFVESRTGKNLLPDWPGITLTAGGYLFEERSQAFSMDAAYLNGKIQLFLNQQPGKEFFVAAGLNIGAVQHRISFDAISDSTAALLLNPNFYKVLPDVSAGIFLSYKGIWLEYAVPPSFRFGKVYGRNGYREFISVGLTQRSIGIGVFNIYNKLAVSNSKFKPLDSFLSGKVTDYIAGVSYVPYSIPIYGGVSFNTRQEKIYFDIGTNIIVKTEGSGILYKRSGLSLKYTFESKGKGFQAHSLGIVFFQNMDYSLQSHGHRYF